MLLAKLQIGRADRSYNGGNYDPDHQIGPTFKFENVNLWELGADGDLYIGDNVRIVAEVDMFDSNAGLFYLIPVSLVHR